MRETMRKKTAPQTPEAASKISDFPEAALSNPWASEEPRILSSPASQVSKPASHRTSSPTKAGFEDVSSSSEAATANGVNPDVTTTPNGAVDGILVTPPKTRRRTVTKPAPHRFELADAPKRGKRSGSEHTRAASSSNSITEPWSAPPLPPPRLTFSDIQTTASTASISKAAAPPLTFSIIQTTASTEPMMAKPRLVLSRIHTTASTKPVKRSKAAKRKSETTKEETPKSEKARSDPIKPETIKRETPKPDTPKPDTIKPDTVKPDTIPNNPFTSPAAEARRQASSTPNGTKTTMLALTAVAKAPPTPYHFIPSSRPLPRDSLDSKVVVMTHGASQISSWIVRAFHAAGCKVIFGDPSPDKARQLISSLGPRDIVHFNKCEVGNYSDIVNLFQLAMTMYGRVDHAIFGVGDDGAQAATIRSAESLWKLGDTKLSARDKIEEVSNETVVDGLRVSDVICASTRFARIALPFLQKGYKPGKAYADKSLTFITSSASFTPMPNLPIYQISQHAVLGTVRALAQSMDPCRGGIRVNGVVTNMMIPTLVPQESGRVSVQLPSDRPEDISRIVLGVVGSGLELESGRNRQKEGVMHGRILYVVREGAYDFQEGLEKTEDVWMGSFAKESFDRAHVGYENGAAIQWMLFD